MNIKKVLLTLLLIVSTLTIVTKADAQFSMFGKEFYTAFGPNAPEEEVNILFLLDIVSLDTARVHIEVKSVSYLKDTIVIPGVMTQIVLPNVECTMPEEVLAGMGVKITSDNDIQVLATSDKHFSCDAWVVYPTGSLGNEYFSLNFPTSGVQTTPSSAWQPGEIVLVATKDSTLVSIAPADDLGNQQPPTLFTVALNSGDVYILEGDRNDSTNDLTGTHIISDKPFAVISGHRRTEVPANYQRPNGGGGSRDCLYEQMPPVTHWNDSIIAVPSSLSQMLGPDVIRIVSATDHNIITIGDQSPGFLDKGEFYEIKSFNTPQIIKGSAPILVGQYTHCSTSNGSTSDPSLTVGQALQQHDTGVVFSVPQLAEMSEQYLTIIIKSNGKDILFLDSSRIISQAFTKIGTGPYAVGRFIISQGLHTIKSSSPYSIRVEGTGTVVSYAYMLPLDYQSSSLSVDRTSSSDLTFYEITPNPISRKNEALGIPFSTTRSTNLEWNLYDITGKEISAVKKITIDAGEGTVAIQLPTTIISGTYFVRIRTLDVPAANVVVRKFVVE